MKIAKSLIRRVLAACGIETALDWDDATLVAKVGKYWDSGIAKYREGKLPDGEMDAMFDQLVAAQEGGEPIELTDDGNAATAETAAPEPAAAATESESGGGETDSAPAPEANGAAPKRRGGRPRGKKNQSKETTTPVVQSVKRRGRPPGSKNVKTDTHKLTVPVSAPAKRGPGRPRGPGRNGEVKNGQSHHAEQLAACAANPRPVPKEGIARFLFEALAKSNPDKGGTPLGKDKLLSRLCAEFPDRQAAGLKNTLNNYVPTRFRDVHGLSVVRTESGGYYINSSDALHHNGHTNGSGVNGSSQTKPPRRRHDASPVGGDLAVQIRRTIGDLEAQIQDGERVLSQKLKLKESLKASLSLVG